MSEPSESQPLRLVGFREVCDRMGHPSRILKMVELLERGVCENPGLAFDTARALVESVCKTVLRERLVEFDENHELPRLVKVTLSSIALAPDPDADGVSEILRRMGGGLQTTAQTLGELRNKEGFISHGRDAYWRDLERIHAEVAARAAETLVYLIYMAHLKYPPVAVEREPIYSDFESFNEYLDEELGAIRIADIDYSPSEILWWVDPPVYRGLLAEFQGLTKDKES